MKLVKYAELRMYLLIALRYINLFMPMHLVPYSNIFLYARILVYIYTSEILT